MLYAACAVMMMMINSTKIDFPTNGAMFVSIRCKLIAQLMPIFGSLGKALSICLNYQIANIIKLNTNDFSQIHHALWVSVSLFETKTNYYYHSTKNYHFGILKGFVYCICLIG